MALGAVSGARAAWEQTVAWVSERRAAGRGPTPADSARRQLAERAVQLQADACKQLRVRRELLGRTMGL